MASALSSQLREVAATSLRDSRSPPPPPPHPACSAAEAVLAAAVVSASPPPPPRPVRRPAALAGWGTVVVDARPCLREGEFPPRRRRGQPRRQPVSAGARERPCVQPSRARPEGPQWPTRWRPEPLAPRAARGRGRSRSVEMGVGPRGGRADARAERWRGNPGTGRTDAAEGPGSGRAHPSVGRHLTSWEADEVVVGEEELGTWVGAVGSSRGPGGRDGGPARV